MAEAATKLPEKTEKKAEPTSTLRGMATIRSATPRNRSAIR